MEANLQKASSRMSSLLCWSPQGRTNYGLQSSGKHAFCMHPGGANSSSDEEKAIVIELKHEVRKRSAHLRCI